MLIAAAAVVRRRMTDDGGGDELGLDTRSEIENGTEETPKGFLRDINIVGLTRMHAAVDAMRPMGFSSEIVRKCVKNLLKVYGNDGWAFIEEAAYKLLIDTILEEPEVPQLEHKPESEHPLLEGTEQGSNEPLESVLKLCDKGVISEEQLECASNVHEADKHINIKEEQNQEQNLDAEVNPTPIKDVMVQPLQPGVQLGFAPAYTPQPIDSLPTNRKRKPCYGWISDDEDNEDDLIQLNPPNCIND
ncbi:hypothetical protein BUALT_Bualt12G0135600 [Buddleja alternifolia]|uniref:WIYLD domain-containing protein n=1 Tax=Buddleja alternifolia TaxID=168488 RepID=A0AAV6WR57_9LAMI|nr:hypothetical protein BUALT_Bualt12G0135600 [Buddleja alternifolia]